MFALPVNSETDVLQGTVCGVPETSSWIRKKKKRFAAVSPNTMSIRITGWRRRLSLPTSSKQTERTKPASKKWKGCR